MYTSSRVEYGYSPSLSTLPRLTYPTLTTGKGELERICGGDQRHSSTMSKRFLRSLRFSSSSSHVTSNPASPSLLFRPMPFDIPTVLAALVRQHHITPSLRPVRENLTQVRATYHFYSQSSSSLLLLLRLLGPGMHACLLPHSSTSVPFSFISSLPSSL